MVLLFLVRAGCALLGLSLAFFVFTLPHTMRGGGGAEMVIAALLLAPFPHRLGKWLVLLPFLLLFLRAKLNRSADLNLQGCGRNLAGLALQLEQARSKDGRYPNTLGRPLPTCPAANLDTYSAAFASSGQNFSLHCSGRHHALHFYDNPNVPADFPFWDRSLKATGKIPSAGRP